MHIIKKATGVALISLVTSAAFAAGPSGTAELVLGSAKQDLDVGALSVDGNDLSFTARLSFNLNENVALEGGYWYAGEADDAIGGVKLASDVDALMIGGKAILPINEKVSFIGRAGFAAWDQELSTSGGQFADGDGTDPYFGLGLELSITDDFIIGAEYTYLEFDGRIDQFKLETEIQQFAVFAGMRF